MDMKVWLDKHVVPLLQDPGGPKRKKTLPLSIHSEIHSPPEDFDLICVYLFAQKDCWPFHVRRLLKDHEFYWDYMRDLNKIVVGGETRVIFGGDGSPFLHDNGMVSCRLFKKIDTIGFVLEIGCDHASKLLAQADVKELYNRFKEEDQLDFHQAQIKFTPPFGEQ